MTAGPALELDRVTRRFGRLTALAGVSATVPAGGALVVFGPNGAGKSTLLAVAAGLVRSFGGRARVFGRDVREDHAPTRRAVGYVSHEGFLYNDLTCRENLVFFARLYGLDRPGASADAMLERFGLGSRARSVVRTLSRGTRQRLALARALIHAPRLLLLDEPHTGLDEASCAALDRTIARFVSAGGAVLMATHEIDRGTAVARRVAVLARGRIAYAGPPEDPRAFRDRYRAVVAGAAGRGVAGREAGDRCGAPR